METCPITCNTDIANISDITDGWLMQNLICDIAYPDTTENKKT